MEVDMKFVKVMEDAAFENGRKSIYDKLRYLREKYGTTLMVDGVDMMDIFLDDGSIPPTEKEAK